MARRKKVLTTTTTDKNEFLQTLSDALGNYSLRCYDIETTAHDLLGVQIYTIEVYKL